MNRFLIVCTFTICALFSLGALANHEGKHGKMKDPTAAERAEMATFHQKMADCLKSDQPFKKCHEQMGEHHKAMAKMGGHGESCSCGEGHKCEGHSHDKGDDHKSKE